MVQEQILSEFKHINKVEVLQAYNTLKGRLLKVQKCEGEAEAEKFIDETLTKLLDTNYRLRFHGVMVGINPKGLALSRSFTKNLKREMRLQLSIWEFFKTMDYNNSPLKQYVHNARGVFNSMPRESKLTINQ